MPNPDTRDVTLQWSNHGVLGDETVELWKKKTTGGAWALDTSVAIGGATQDHEFLGLDAGAAYQFQIRSRRGATYREEYASSDPDDWPADSLLVNTLDLPKPVLSFDGWERTSSTEQFLHFSWTNAVSTRATKFYIDTGSGWTLVDTIAAGTSDYDYEIGAEAGTTPDFKIAQADEDGAETNPSDTSAVYAGLEAPTNKAQVGGPDHYEYSLSWTVAHSGAQTRISDRWTGTYQNRTLTAADATSETVSGLEKNEPGDTPTENVKTHVRIRHELTSFTVTDVSEWVGDDQDCFDVDLTVGETAYGDSGCLF